MTPAEQTMKWVRDFVILHGLCPFAALPFEQGRVVAVPVEEADEEGAFYAALTQVQALVDEQSEVETILLVFPELLADFETFLDFVYTFEEALAETGADELVQLAHFHPNYQFDGVAVDDPGNRTNRSPFPILQLLLVDSVATAVAGYPDVEGIPGRNIVLMRELFGHQLGGED